MRLSRLISRLAAALIAAAAAATAAADGDAPRRVVSINLCTDQLAMMLAGDGQLHSVSHLALDPMVSKMTATARGLAINHGSAEEIFLMRPDLVLAGTLSRRSTVSLLRALGIEVVEFPPATRLEDIPERIRRMGAILGRDQAAHDLAHAFERRLALLRRAPGSGPRAVLYQANGIVSGDATLSGQIIAAAGFVNAAEEAGYRSGMRMPLEVLALTEPEVVITALPYAGGSRAEEVLTHPVVRALRAGRTGAVIGDQSWVCGTPHVLDILESLVALRQTMREARP